MSQHLGRLDLRNWCWTGRETLHVNFLHDLHIDLTHYRLFKWLLYVYLLYNILCLVQFLLMPVPGGILLQQSKKGGNKKKIGIISACKTTLNLKSKLIH